MIILPVDRREAWQAEPGIAVRAQSTSAASAHRRGAIRL